MFRSIRCSAVAVLVALPAGGVAAQSTPASFEGRITAEMSDNQVVILSKNGKSRMEMSASGVPMAMIMDYDAGAILTLMPAQRMYMRMDLKQMEQTMRSMTQTTETAGPPKYTRTGRRETIAGVSCEHFLFEAKEGKQMDVCAAKGMGFFGGGGGMGRRGAGVPGGYEQMMKEFKEGFFPLRMEMIEGTTRTQFMVVKTIERQQVDAGQFEVPAGFSEMKMPTTPGGPRP